MKKIILVLFILLSVIYLNVSINAISATKTSGDVLDNLIWGKISNITDKISVDGGNIRINGKIYVSGKLCDNNGECLKGEAFSWVTEDWGTCSETCGGGTQTRIVSCINDETAVTVSDDKCTEVKPVISQACNTVACVEKYAGSIGGGYYMLLDGNTCSGVASAHYIAADWCATAFGVTGIDKNNPTSRSGNNLYFTGANGTVRLSPGAYLGTGTCGTKPDVALYGVYCNLTN